MYLYTYVASKNITITEETYEKLRAHKRADESFSDVIERLTTSSTPPIDSAGAYPGLGDAVEDAREEFEHDVAERANELSR